MIGLSSLLAVLPASGYEQRVDCGSDQFSFGPGLEIYLADQEYNGVFGWGYVGGSPSSGTGPENVPRSRFRDNDAPYLHRRLGTFEYRFDLPNGDYLVTLGFAEWDEHGVGRRVFDVAMEGAPALTDLDIFAAAGDMWRVLEYRRTVSVTDGQLNIDFTSNVLEGSICAIEVIDLPVAPGAPAAPTGVEARDAYGRVDVLWEHNTEPDLLGYRVYRSLDIGGPWTRITGGENLAVVYNDLSAEQDQSYFYKVTAVDVEGSESLDSTIVSAFAWNSLSSTLPIYRLTLSDADLAALNEHPYEDLREPAVFEHDGQIWADAEARYRGNIARHYAKKNWKVFLPDGELHDGQDTFNINADMVDYNLVRKRLAFELYREAGIITADLEPAHLVLNGEYYGVAQVVENVDAAFVSNHGLDDRGELFKAIWPTGHLRTLNTAEEYRIAYEQKGSTLR